VFKLKMASAKEFRNALAAIGTLIDEGTFVIDGEGLKLRAMDPSRIAMVDFMWGRSVFDEYEAPEEGVKLCVNIDEFQKLLKKATKGESIELSLDQATGRVKLTIRGKYTRSFTVPRLETVGEEVPGELKIPFDVRITLDADELATIEFPRTCEAVIDFEVKEPSTAMFDVGMLQKMLKAGSALADVVVVEFSTNKPIKLDFRLPYEGKLIFYLAPRVEAE